MNITALVQNSLDAVIPNGALIRQLKDSLAIERSEPLCAALHACLEACYACDEREVDRTLDHLLTHFKPPENWREMMIADIQAGVIEYAALAQAFDDEFARQAFNEASVSLTRK